MLQFSKVKIMIILLLKELNSQHADIYMSIDVTYGLAVCCALVVTRLLFIILDKKAVKSEVNQGP